mgnify:CR=1 FL=1
MGEVKPAEVSAILRKQLSGINTESKLEEIGTVLQVGDLQYSSNFFKF